MHNPYETFIRNDTAKHIREVRKILRRSPPYPEPDELQEGPEVLFSAGVFAICLLLALLLMIGTCRPAQAYTNEQYVNAIYLAEGSSHATYLFGIRSVKYSTAQEARKICLRTVRHCRRRYKKYGFKRYSHFIQFLGSIYCPVSGRNQTAGEMRLNRHWVKNVEFYLKKESAT